MRYLKMTKHCWVKNCNNNAINSKGKIRFYQIPKVITKEGEKVKELSQARQDKWLMVIKYDGSQNLTGVSVCSDHFHSGNLYGFFKIINLFTGILFCIGKPHWSLDPNHPDYAPSLKLSKTCNKSPSAALLARYSRVENRALQQMLNPLERNYVIPSQQEPMNVDNQNLLEPECVLIIKNEVIKVYKIVLILPTL